MATVAGTTPLGAPLFAGFVCSGTRFADAGLPQRPRLERATLVTIAASGTPNGTSMCFNGSACSTAFRDGYAYSDGRDLHRLQNGDWTTVPIFTGPVPNGSDR